MLIATHHGLGQAPSSITGAPADVVGDLSKAVGLTVWAYWPYLLAGGVVLWLLSRR